jgi:ectoine hydroxylase-related dioxygenase (phytanoyl-CoA dioxygenase family)
MAAEIRPFIDSRDILNDGAALRHRMQEDGYLFVRGFFDRDLVMGLRTQMLEIAARHGFVDTSRPLEEAVANMSAACIEPEPAYIVVLQEMYQLEGLHALKHEPRVRAFFERLLGGPGFAHPMQVVRNVFPKLEYATPAHQDYVHVQGTVDTYTFWMPLCDCPIEMGCVAVAVGSHKGGVAEFRLARAAGNVEIVESFEGQWASADFEAGDVLVFHSLTAHKAFPNLTNKLRQSTDFRVQSLAGATIVEKEALPYFATRMSWDQVYATWKSREHQNYWKSLPINIVPYDRKYLNARDEMAFAAAELGDPIAIETLLLIRMRDPRPEKRQRAEELLTKLGADDSLKVDVPA